MKSISPSLKSIPVFKTAHFNVRGNHLFLTKELFPVIFSGLFNNGNQEIDLLAKQDLHCNWSGEKHR
jgi:hypothetical protein